MDPSIMRIAEHLALSEIGEDTKPTLQFARINLSDEEQNALECVTSKS